MQNHYLKNIAKVEQNCQMKIGEARNECAKVEKLFLQRVEGVESQYRNKLKEFQAK
jgi:hypothetical protein